MFRINLSHTKTDDVLKSVLEIKKHTSVPVCLDTEGPQIRTGLIKNGQITLKENNIFNIVGEEKVGDSQNISLRPKEALPKLKIGDILSLDFDSTLLRISKKNNGQIKAKVICDGHAFSNKAVTLDRIINLPILTKKDLVAIDVIKKLKLKNISLSFVNKKEDIDYVRTLIGKDVRIISKIETNMALINLDSIIAGSDLVLIDRGDLSREEPINKIPLLQKEIIKKANEDNTHVLVATNFLESMVLSRKPLRSEVNDIMNTLLDGADGLVLAAETAIGKYPAECANMVKRMVKYYEISQAGYCMNKLLESDSFLLSEPHGGFLVDRFDEKQDFNAIEELYRVKIDELALLDAEQMAIGTYSPIKGFMTKDELSCVLENHKLPNGLVWTMPLLLQVTGKEYWGIKKNMDISLVFEEDKLTYATLHVKDLFPLDLGKVAMKCFGTSNKDHSGVGRLYQKGEYCVGGEITLVRQRRSGYKEFEYTPIQMRNIFEHKEWSKVAALHASNAVNRSHEYFQKTALEKYNLDGVLLHPINGPKTAPDFLPHIILKSYKIMQENYDPNCKVFFGVVGGYSRYAGPREVVFEAICRKNFGCSHFITGGDHFDSKYLSKTKETRKLFDKIGDIGIEPIFFDKVYYCSKCKQYIESCKHDKKAFWNFNDEQVKEIFLKGEKPPSWYINDKISNMISAKIDNGEDVFL